MLAYANAFGYLCIYIHTCVEIGTISIQNDKTLDISSVLISLSYNRNKKKNSSTKYIGLTRVTNSRTIVHKS